MTTRNAQIRSTTRETASAVVAFEGARTVESGALGGPASTGIDRGPTTTHRVKDK